MNRAELAAYIQEQLRESNIDVVLSGGSCVSIYSNNQYVSMDLDLVNNNIFPLKKKLVNASMNKIGFIKYDRHYIHPDTEIIVEFPLGPLAVGEEQISNINTIELSTGNLSIISPTDCVKDRLTWFYHDNDLQGLHQALLVAKSNQIDIAEVERWSKSEDKEEEFTKIKKELYRLQKPLRKDTSNEIKNMGRKILQNKIKKEIIKSKNNLSSNKKKI